MQSSVFFCIVIYMKYINKRTSLILILIIILILTAATAVLTVIGTENLRRLRADTDDLITYMDVQIEFIDALMQGNELLSSGEYYAARDKYILALDLSENIRDADQETITNMLLITEWYIFLYDLLEHADGFLENADYDIAVQLYEEAESIASALNYSAGVEIARDGINEVTLRIILARLAEAEGFLAQGDQSYLIGDYENAIIHYREALDVYNELDDRQGVHYSDIRILLAEQEIEELERQIIIRLNQEKFINRDEAQVHDDIVNNNDPEDKEVLSELELNYEHNIGIDFDLSTLIDAQNRRPANQIKMGSTDGRNEGWYNGCGWVAAYNALILLDQPQHPAEIVRYYEINKGTVLGGVLGTYPHAIERYFTELEYDVEHVLFPQISVNIDEAIKNARVAILAYLHRSAAHYITIEYRESDEKFIVYNDNYARARADQLGFKNDTVTGSAIDSVSALIGNTSEILFSFSLITIN